MNFMKPGVFYLQKMMNFMKMRTSYKKLPLSTKNSALHTNKKLKPQIWALQKTPFLKLIETPAMPLSQRKILWRLVWAISFWLDWFKLVLTHNSAQNWDGGKCQRRKAASSLVEKLRNHMSHRTLSDSTRRGFLVIHLPSQVHEAPWGQEQHLVVLGGEGLANGLVVGVQSHLTRPQHWPGLKSPDKSVWARWDSLQCKNLLDKILFIVQSDNR